MEKLNVKQKLQKAKVGSKRSVKGKAKEVAEEKEEQNDLIDLLGGIADSKRFHKYSPEKNNVKRIIDQIKPVKSKFSKDLLTFLNKIIVAHNLDSLKEKIDKSTLPKDNTTNCTIGRKVLQTMANVYKKKPSMSHPETTFNVKLISPLMYAAIDSLESRSLSPSFVPGEEELLSMTKQLESIGVKFGHRKIYKADGIVRLEDNVEILLVETADAFLNDNPTKLAFDNSKGMFGILSMIKAIADQYRFCGKETFKKLKVLYLQPANCTMRLWTLSYDKNGTYRYERVAKVFISEEFEKKDDCLLNLALFTIELKNHMKGTLDTLKAIKDEHEKVYIEHYSNNANSQPLTLSDIMCPKIFKISYNSHSKGFCNQELESPEHD